MKPLEIPFQNQFVLCGYSRFDPKTSKSGVLISVATLQEYQVDYRWMQSWPSFNVWAFGDVGEYVLKNVRKGDVVRVDGKLQKQHVGEGVWKVYLVADYVELVKLAEDR